MRRRSRVRAPGSRAGWPRCCRAAPTSAARRGRSRRARGCRHTSIVRLPGLSSSTALVRSSNSAAKPSTSSGSKNRVVDARVGASRPLRHVAARLVGVVGHQQRVAGCRAPPAARRRSPRRRSGRASSPPRPARARSAPRPAPTASARRGGRSRTGRPRCGRPFGEVGAVRRRDACWPRHTGGLTTAPVHSLAPAAVDEAGGGLDRGSSLPATLRPAPVALGVVGIGAPFAPAAVVERDVVLAEQVQREQQHAGGHRRCRRW